MDDDSPAKKKVEITDINVHLENEVKKIEKTDVEDPKPRIVLTIRSEKSSAKSSNMKVVSTEEKHEEFSPRRSNRTRGKWEWVCDSDTSGSPKKDKSASENDEEPLNTKRSTSRRNKDSENVVANAIARKEKLYDIVGGPQRPTRRIKKGKTGETPIDEGVKTRRSGRQNSCTEKSKMDISEEPEVIDDNSEDQSSVMKLKHLCELGLKAIDPEDEDEEADESQEAEEDEVDEVSDDEIDDDSEVISKLLEADEDTGSDDDFLCEVGSSRRKTRRARPRRSSRRATIITEDGERSYRPRRKRIRSNDEEEPQSEPEQEEESNPAGGDDGSEPACPVDESAIVATCLCETPSNVYAAPDELTEPVFCQAIEMVDGVRVGCSHGARKDADSYASLVRAGLRAPYIMACSLHEAQLRKHMGCPTCGLFCTQGIFYQCSKGHLFHLECGLPYGDSKLRPGCPHCGVYSYRWQPANREVTKVKVEMKCSNKRIFLPDQREQCTPAYLGFTKQSKCQAECEPLIPEDLLPPTTIDLKQLCRNIEEEEEDMVNVPPVVLCEAILTKETVERLVPKIVAERCINGSLSSVSGGSCVHAATQVAHLGALWLLRCAGANLDVQDNKMRTPLLLAVTLYLDKTETKPAEKKMKEESVKEEKEEMEVDPEKEEEKPELIEEDNKIDNNTSESEKDRPPDEDLLKVIRYLVAAGCDVNRPDSEGTTPLHIAAQYGNEDVCTIILESGRANLEARDHGGWTPLVWAAENNHQQVVRLLLREGADPLSTDTEGNSVVHWCVLAGSGRALLALVEHAPATLQAHNSHADTPLHVAARQGHYACVVILLARGAKTDVENSAGELPVDVCSGACQAAISLNMQMTMAVNEKSSTKKILSSDISNGREWWPVACVNELDDENAPDDFTYVTQNITPTPLHIDTSIQTMQGCTCVDDCTGEGCACCVLGVRQWVRRSRLAPGFPYHDPPMLFECNPTCSCNQKRCTNNVVSTLIQRGSLLIRGEVYRVGGARGWGLRSTQRVSRGSPVAVYCGELVAMSEADTRANDHYMFALELHHDLLQQCTEKTQLCIDAARFGGAARFINHSCRPNLAPVRVFTHARDLRLPTVTLFATKDLRPGEQLTFDYGDKFWSVKSKWMKCECGAVDCRYSNISDDND